MMIIQSLLNSQTRKSTKKIYAASLTNLIARQKFPVDMKKTEVIILTTQTMHHTFVLFDSPNI